MVMPQLAHAVRLGADQIIAGAALNLIALGVTGALYRAVLGATGTALVLPTLPAIDELADALRKAAPPVARIEAPPGVLYNVTRQGDGGRPPCSRACASA